MVQHDGSLAFDLRSLTAFLEVAEAGSMTLAADRLGLTQSGVTRAVAKLEAELGTELLDRRARPFIPTAAGLELMARARDLLVQAEHLQSSVRDIGAATLPSVRLGLIDSFTVTAGPALIRELRGHTRSVTVWSGISPNLRQDLLRRRLDVMVSTDPMTGFEGLEHRRIMREPFMLIMPTSMADAIAEPSLEDLARNHPFVRYSVRSLIGARIERHLKDRGIEVPDQLEFDGSEAVFAMVAAGLGWAITTPLCLIHSYSYTAGLTVRPLPGPGFDRTLYIVGRSGELVKLRELMATAAVRIARDLVEEKVRPIAPWAADTMRIG